MTTYWEDVVRGGGFDPAGRRIFPYRDNRCQVCQQAGDDVGLWGGMFVCRICAFPHSVHRNVDTLAQDCYLGW